MVLPDVLCHPDRCPAFFNGDEGRDDGKLTFVAGNVVFRPRYQVLCDPFQLRERIGSFCLSTFSVEETSAPDTLNQTQALLEHVKTLADICSLRGPQGYLGVIRERKLRFDGLPKGMLRMVDNGGPLLETQLKADAQRHAVDVVGVDWPVSV